MGGGEWPYQLQLPEKGKRYVQNDADTCRCSVKKKKKSTSSHACNHFSVMLNLPHGKTS